MFFEGYTIYNTVASYIHMHFASNPSFAKGFVACVQVAEAPARPGLTLQAMYGMV